MPAYGTATLFKHNLQRARGHETLGWGVDMHDERFIRCDTRHL